MWIFIIDVDVEIFAQKKLYLRQVERKINNFERFFNLWEKLVTKSYIKNNRDYVYVNR